MNSLPTQHELLPNLGVLDRLLSDIIPDERVAAVHRETEQLCYYLRCACVAVHRLEASRAEALGAFDSLAVPPGAMVILDPERADPICFALDLYLFALRRSFNALVLYIRHCKPDKSLPEGLPDLVKGIANGAHRFDPAVEDLLTSFWSGIGAQAKGYRDQTAHKAVIVSTCILSRTSSGSAALSAFLPDDPNEKSPSRITYNPGVPLMSFVLESLEKTLLLCNAVVERLIDVLAPDDSEARRTGVVLVAFRGGELTVDSGKLGEPIPFPRTVAQVVEAAGHKPNFPDSGV